MRLHEQSEIEPCGEAERARRVGEIADPRQRAELVVADLGESASRCDAFVVAFVATTVTPGKTALVASRTTPVILAPVWAEAKGLQRRATRATTHAIGR
jgi:hypothetical protein